MQNEPPILRTSMKRRFHGLFFLKSCKNLVNEELKVALAQVSSNDLYNLYLVFMHHF